MKRVTLTELLNMVVTVPSTISGDFCEQYTGPRITDGLIEGTRPLTYGRIGTQGRIVRAHRYAYALYNHLNLEDLRGKIVMHICNNPLCIKREHLKLGTHSEYMNACVKKGRYPYRHNVPKLGFEDAQKAKTLRSEGLLIREIAKLLNVSKSHIGNILAGRRWRTA